MAIRAKPWHALGAADLVLDARIVTLATGTIKITKIGYSKSNATAVVGWALRPGIANIASKIIIISIEKMAKG